MVTIQSDVAPFRPAMWLTTASPRAVSKLMMLNNIGHVRNKI